MPPNFEPHASPTPPTPESRPTIPPPIPNPLKQDHSLPVGEQQTVDVNNLPKVAGNNLFQNDNPNVLPNDQAYDFILNSSESNHSHNLKVRLPHNTLARVATIAGAILLLIIVVSVIGSLFKGASIVPYIASVIEDQQEIIHITTLATSAPDISSNNQTFVATANLVLNSNSSQLQSYLASNGSKLTLKALNLKISSSVDNELNSAETAGNFNSTFNQVAKGQIGVYMQDIKTAFNKTTGPRGRALLSSFYKQANLLLVSLSNGS